MQTKYPNVEEMKKTWWLIDAANQPLGRVATRVASLLRGKHKPSFTPHMDTGDFVVVINAEKVALSGNKWEDKTYFRHSRFFGSLKETSAAEMREKNPAELLEKAVHGMLPTNKLSRRLIRKMKAYAGADHPHKAQKLETFTIS
jgi:large subunit ribosomal protein L13